jgi:hypothetical protein
MCVKIDEKKIKNGNKEIRCEQQNLRCSTVG